MLSEELTVDKITDFSKKINLGTKIFLHSSDSYTSIKPNKTIAMITEKYDNYCICILADGRNTKKCIQWSDVARWNPELIEKVR